MLRNGNAEGGTETTTTAHHANHRRHARCCRLPVSTKPTQVVKEQAGALRREEDRRKAVESALARLRKERQAPPYMTPTAGNSASEPPDVTSPLYFGTPCWLQPSLRPFAHLRPRPRPRPLSCRPAATGKSAYDCGTPTKAETHQQGPLLLFQSRRHQTPTPPVPTTPRTGSAGPGKRGLWASGWPRSPGAGRGLRPTREGVGGGLGRRQRGNSR